MVDTALGICIFNGAFSCLIESRKGKGQNIFGIKMARLNNCEGLMGQYAYFVSSGYSQISKNGVKWQFTNSFE
jgi:hypothetical protein